MSNPELTLYKHPNAILERSCGFCGKPDSALVEAMLEACGRFCGYALAAPQIGLSISLFVIPRHASLPSSAPMVVADPELSDLGPDAWMEESCLSIPGFRARVRRPDYAVLSYTDAAGERRTYRCRGLLARIVQHECDHLRGRLFTGRLGRLGWEAWCQREVAAGRSRPLTPIIDLRSMSNASL